MVTFIPLLAAHMLGFATAEPSITASSLRAHVEYLASPELGGRLTGSEGERKAGDYAKKWFSDLGLLPAGTAGTYFQEFPVTFGGEATPETNLRLLNSAGNEIAAKVGVDFNPVYNSVPDALAGLPVVYAGEGLASPERDDYKGIDVKGKAVAVFVSPNGGATTRHKAQAAKERGAAAILFIGTPSGQGLLGLDRRYGIENSSGFAAVAISSGLFERVSGMKFDEARKQAISGRVAPGFAKGLKVSFKSEIRPKSVTGRNVMALLPGTDPAVKDQYIIIGAHLDHVGRGEFGSRTGADSIHFGADDNASGSAAVLELARYFAETKSNRRSILFQLYSGEELGLIGSTHFVKNPTIDLSRVSWMLNLDMIGGLRENKIIIDGVRTSPLWPDFIKELAADFVVQVDREDLRGRSDHAGFERSNIPVTFFFTGENEHYHTETDSAATLNYDGAAKIVNMAVAWIKKVDALSGMVPVIVSGVVVDRTPPKQESSSGGAGTRRVRVGLIPSYGDGGPGLLLDGVQPNSPAEKAGLMAGDRIMKWGEKTIGSIEDIQSIFENAEPGKPVKVVVVRNGKEITMTVTPEGIGVQAA